MLGSLMMLASGVLASSPSARQVVRDPLLLGQLLREVGDDAAGERDVPRLDLDPRARVKARTMGSSA